MDRVARGLARLLENLLGCLFLVITAATIVLVILRYFFGTTIVGGQEFIAFCFIYTTAIGAAVLLAKENHIAIALFVGLLGLGLGAGCIGRMTSWSPSSTACSSC